MVKGLLLETFDTREHARLSQQCIVTLFPPLCECCALFPLQGQTTRFTKVVSLVVGLGLTANRRIARAEPSGARIRVMSNARGSRSRFTYFKTYIGSLNFFNTQRPRCLRGCGQLAAYRVARIAMNVRVTTRGGLEKEIENYAARE